MIHMMKGSLLDDLETYLANISTRCPEEDKLEHLVKTLAT